MKAGLRSPLQNWIDPSSMRLNKFISRSGLTSRRKAEMLIAEGRVRVNGEVIGGTGIIVDPRNDVVVVDGKNIQIPSVRWIKMNKPPGVLTTAKDDFARPTIYDILPQDMQSLRYVGRLDYLTEGLLILTNDGNVANQLQHPSYEIEREYRVLVEGRISNAILLELRSGVELDDGFARPAWVEIVQDKGSDSQQLLIVMKEGRNREVRRLMAAVGLPVAHLRRMRFGPLRLGSLEVGQFEELHQVDIEALKDCVS